MVSRIKKQKYVIGIAFGTNKNTCHSLFFHLTNSKPFRVTIPFKGIVLLYTYDEPETEYGVGACHMLPRITLEVLEVTEHGTTLFVQVLH